MQTRYLIFEAYLMEIENLHKAKLVKLLQFVRNTDISITFK